MSVLQKYQMNYKDTPGRLNIHDNVFFHSVEFNTDGSILANGWRGEADSDSAIGVRYDAATGVVLE